MNKKDFTKLIIGLAEAYRQELSATQTSVYYEMLKDLDLDKLNNTIKTIIKTKKFFPTIAEIRESYFEDKKLLADKEWGEVLSGVRKYGIYDQEKLLNELNPITRNVVERLGLERLCVMEQTQVPMERKAFVEMFNNFNEYHKEELLCNNTLLLSENE